MAITNASRLADFSSGIGTGGAILQVDNANKEVGIGTTNPNATLTVNYSGIAGTSLFVHGDARVTGVITATSFSGSGANLTGLTTSAVPGISTQLNSKFGTLQTSGITTISATTLATSTTTGALIVSGGVGIAKSLFVGEGISVAGTITYDDVTNIDSVGIVTAGKGLRATTGGLHVVAGVSTLGGGSSMADNVSSYWGTGADLQIFSDGDNGVLKGLNGRIYLQSDSGINLTRLGNAETFGVFHANAGVDLYYDNSKKFETVGTGVSIFGGMKVQSGLLRENVNIVANKLSAAPTISVDNGMMHYFTTQETTTTKPNIISSAGINTDMAIGDTMCLTVITTAASGGYSFDWRVDGVEASAGVTSSWVGGSAPSAGGSSGLDTYSLTFIKTASARYTMIGNLINSA